MPSCCFGHDSALSRDGASDDPGAIHSAVSQIFWTTTYNGAAGVRAPAGNQCSSVRNAKTSEPLRCAVQEYQYVLDNEWKAARERLAQLEMV